MTHLVPGSHAACLKILLLFFINFLARKEEIEMRERVPRNALDDSHAASSMADKFKFMENLSKRKIILIFAPPM